MRSAKGGISKLDDGYWKITVDAGRDEDGKRHQMSRRIRGSRKTAQEALNALLLEAGDINTKSLVTIGDFIDNTYLPMVKKRSKTTTYESYERRLRLHVPTYIKVMRFCDIKASDISTALDDLEPTIAKEVRKTISAMFTEAVYRGYIGSNPCNAVRPVETKRYEPDVLDESGIAVYLSHFRGTTIEPAILLAIGGGFRRGEIVALNVEDIDFATGAVLVDNSVTVTTSGVENTDTKTHRARVVHLPMAITDRLNDILPEHGAIIVGNDGNRMRPDILSRIYARALTSLPDGTKRITLKNLRHSSLTLAFDSGADIQDVANRGGHANVSTTTRYYVRPKGERDIKAAQLMDAALATIGNNYKTSETRDEVTQAYEQHLRRIRLTSVVSF